MPSSKEIAIDYVLDFGPDGRNYMVSEEDAKAAELAKPFHDDATLIVNEIVIKPGEDSRVGICEHFGYCGVCASKGWDKVRGCQIPQEKRSNKVAE